jgi:hypothetical protein
MRAGKEASRAPIRRHNAAFVLAQQDDTRLLAVVGVPARQMIKSSRFSMVAPMIWITKSGSLSPSRSPMRLMPFASVS